MTSRANFCWIGKLRIADETRAPHERGSADGIAAAGASLRGATLAGPRYFFNALIASLIASSILARLPPSRGSSTCVPLLKSAAGSTRSTTIEAPASESCAEGSNFSVRFAVAVLL